MKRYPGKSFDNKGRGRSSNRRDDFEMHEATCDDCGGVAKLPFKPSSDKPVYCSKCFEKHDNKHQDRRGGGDRDRRPRGGNDNRKVVEQLEKLNSNIERLVEVLSK
jgi:CxxC-x17-CxxC domain-containing protein